MLSGSSRYLQRCLISAATYRLGSTCFHPSGSPYFSVPYVLTAPTASINPGGTKSNLGFPASYLCLPICLSTCNPLTLIYFYPCFYSLQQCILPFRFSV